VRVLICTLIVAAAVSAAAGAATQRHAVLTVTNNDPLAAKGTGFAARERLRLTASAGGATWRRIVVTSGSGGFSVTFGTAASYDPCTGPLVVTASGPQDHVTVKRPPRECPPPG